jgi:hypothetical protein
MFQSARRRSRLLPADCPYAQEAIIKKIDRDKPRIAPETRGAGSGAAKVPDGIYLRAQERI